MRLKKFCSDPDYSQQGSDLLITRPGGGTVTIKNFVASHFEFSLKDELNPPPLAFSAVIIPTPIVDLLYPDGWFDNGNDSIGSMQNHFLSAYYRLYRETRYNQDLGEAYDFLNTSYDMVIDVSAATATEYSALDNAFAGYDSGFESGALVDRTIFTEPTLFARVNCHINQGR